MTEQAQGVVLNGWSADAMRESLRLCEQRYEERIAALESRLARVQPVIEAARKWSEWHGEQRDPVVPMSRPVRELHDAIRALDKERG